MSNKRLSELPPFVGKDLLMECEKRGVAILEGLGITDWNNAVLVGLVNKIAEQDEQTEELITKLAV